MNLRSLRITTYLAPMALMVACGSNASTEAPLAGGDGEDASAANSSGGNGSSGDGNGNGSSSGDDSTPTPAPSSSACAQDSDCTGECDGSVVCCCDLSSVTCYSPASGQCGGDDAGDDAGSNDGGGFPI